MNRMLEQGIQGINDESEKHRGQGVALAQPPGMADGRSWRAIEQNTHTGCGQQDEDPLAPVRTEAEVLKNFEKKQARDGVEGTRDVKLEQYQANLEVVKLVHCLLHE